MNDIRKIALHALKTILIVVGLSLPIETLFAHNINCNSNPDNISGIISYDTSGNYNTYCELCGVGQVRIAVTNPTHEDMANFSIQHTFDSDELEYVPGSTQGGGDPVISNGGRTLTWTSAQIAGLAQIDGKNNHFNYNNEEIIFQVRSRSGTEGNLVNIDRDIQATADFNFCPLDTNTSGTVSTSKIPLPIHEPVPTVTKLGRNVDSNQGTGSYTSTVYGNINDDVIWRIRVTNSGLADLEDLKFDDLLQNGNFQINFACPTEGEANSIALADGAGPVGNCINSSNSINDFAVDDPFGNPANDEPGASVDVPANGGFTDIFLVGKITNSCTANRTNTVSNIEWGCEVDTPDGGITQTSTGASAGTSTTTLSSLVNNNNLQITRALTGLNTNQPVGSRGLMTITIRNLSGGSVKNLVLTNTLPVEYVVDSTFTPTLTMAYAYGNYDGRVDTLGVSATPADPLNFTAPVFTLTSSTVHPDHADQLNMLRHGDVAVIRFRVVMVKTDHFDIEADLDVTPEIISDHDPDNVHNSGGDQVSNQLDVAFDDFCTGPQSVTYNDLFDAFPEDLDISIPAATVFILTNDPNQRLPLQVDLTNNGGANADNYQAYVTFGATMEVVTVPNNCSLTSNPPPLEVWDDPFDIPPASDYAVVYLCDRGTIGPGATESFTFEVVKVQVSDTNGAARLLEDDLTFRADVVGEVVLSDNTLTGSGALTPFSSGGALLDFPTVSTTGTGGQIDNRANNYSLDAVRAKVIGFNLTKTQVGNCSENNPPPANPDVLVQIGEECKVHIETGGWFGFETPGFTYIAVQRIQVDDQLPDGQGFISTSVPSPASTSMVKSIVLNPPPSPLDEGTFNWTFNQNTGTEQITEKDHWFRMDTTSRILNDPIDTRASPNVHAATSSNVLVSTFEAVFNSGAGNVVFTLGPSTVGYPSAPIRTVNLTVTEPYITVDKQVCNETLNGTGPTCSSFSPNINDGDTQDSYIYRVTLTNQATSSGVARAPAYNITATDILDASDLVYVVPFGADGLDNDGDGDIDGADGDGEGSISDNLVYDPPSNPNQVPAVLTFAHTHSNALLKLNAGSSVTFYYRVDPDDAIAPLQTLTNSASATYDSLEGDSGNQTVVLSNNSEAGGARVYTSAADSATVQMLPLQSFPKIVTRLSNKVIAGAPEEVSIGEEIEYELKAWIPAANLEAFEIHDTLPAGISCSEAPIIDLDAAPYSAAGFFPGGQFTPVCSNNQVSWYFGPQELTANLVNNRFEFTARFITRVDNTAGVNNADTISNGEPATTTYLRYENELGAQVTLDFGQVDVLVREPVIALTKTYESATNDAADVITVTVTAQNTGTATAYNLKVFDDLDDVSNLTFLANVTGTDPPSVDLALGANRPIFKWASGAANYDIIPGETISFTFDISVDIGAEPLEVLDNTIQASWQSLPDQNTALNNSGAGPIGADGSATGMRIGAIPNAGDTVNNYETTATTFTTVPALTIDKSDLDNTQPVEIGVHKNYQIVINLPEGTTKNLIVNDNLNFSGLTYILENNATYDVTYTFNEIASVNSDVTPDETSLIAFPADAATGTAIWNFGTVVTNSEDDTTGTPSKSPSITINYYARVNNDINTDRLDTLQNQVTVNYTNGETPATTEAVIDTTPVLTVTEAILGVTKVATLISPVPITGGDIIEYVITVANTGDATAYDVNIVDTLPTDLDLYTTFTPTADIGGAVAGFITTPTGSTNGPLIWGRDNADNNLDIPAGSSLILTYRVIVEAGSESNLTYTNSVLVDWTSLNDTVANSATYERTGAGCPTITAPNDYCVGPITSDISTADTNTLDKTVTSDTYGAPIGTVRVGDIITYQLSLNLQEGTTSNVNVVDVLPTGLSFVDIVSINGDTTASYSTPGSGSGSNFSYTDIAAASVPTAGDTGTLNFNIGTVINDPTGDATTDTLVIVYRAKVDTDTLAQLPTTTLTNTATLQYIDGNSVAVVDNARLQKTYDITLLQPVMTVPTKIDRGGFVSIANVQVGIDTMQFRLESCNTTGLAPAYNVKITDQLPTQLNDTTLTVPVVNINGALATAGVDYTYTAPVGRGSFLQFDLIDPVNPSECVTIDYDIGIYADFPANQTWFNSVTVDEYWSLPAQSGQKYSALGPTTFGMFNPAPFLPPAKALLTPASGEATIGDEIVYEITIPTHGGVRHDITITDTLDSRLEYVGATVSGGFTLIDNTVAPTNVNLRIDTIPGNQSATIQLRTRVVNSAGVNAGDSFTNTLQYTYADTSGGATINGGAATTPTSLRIIEPLLALGKTVANVTNPGNPPIAGDVLRYSLIFTATGGAGNDNFSDAFDVIIVDTLSLGLTYQTTTSAVDGAGNTITDPTIVGNGTTIGQTLTWNLADATADIDVVEGTVVTVTYDVVVLNTVLADQDLTNSAVIQWTSVDGASSYERTGTASPAYNDYFTGPATTTLTTPDNTNITKIRLTDTYGAGDADVRIGDVIEYELRLALQEGLHNNLVVIDTLPQGLVFEGVVNINGDTTSPYNAVAPFSHNNITPAISGDPVTGPTTVTYTFGNLTNVADADNTNDEFVIVYRARVLNNVHAQVNSTTLTNTAVLNYTTASGAQTDNSSVSVTLLQPNITVTKSAVAAGGDTVLAPNEVVTYTVNITNTGTTSAYDAVVEDVIPAGMRSNGITMISTSLQPAGTGLTNIAPTYNATTGLANWNFDSGVADAYSIPVGQSLRLVYSVQADAAIGAGQTLTNQAVATLYYSFDDEAVPVLGGINGVREIYGPSNTATKTLTTTAPAALLKENPATTDATIGETFTYRITVPDTTVDTWLHDVRIVDNLSASADLSYVSMTKINGSESWTPANTGTTTSLVIEDATIGIDIPPNEQIIIDVTVVVNDVAANIKGRTFTNTATYTYNQSANDSATQQNGVADTTANMTIIEPDNLTLVKTGPAANINIGTAETFTLNIQNIGNSPAWDATIVDVLPTFAPAAGGMCDTAPTNIIAQMYLADGTTTVGGVLLQGTDYVVNYSACTLTLTMQTAAAAIVASATENNRLIITYQAELDSDTPHNSSLTNTAAVTQWFSLDTAGAGATGEIRTYTRALTNGSVGTLDHEDAYMVTTDTPAVTITKNVYNVTTGQSGIAASPGDTLRYSIDITNTSAVELFGFSFTDDLDALNTTAMFVAGSLNLTTVPVGANITNTDVNGGSKGTGLVDIRNLSLGANGSGNEAILIEFEVKLVATIADGTIVYNQGHMLTNGLNFPSDDPNVVGTTDPTETLISSAPLFEVLKISTDLTGDANVLLSGDTLRYTITVKNIGNEDSINTILRDQLPANTTYVAGSTRLNGSVVNEPTAGVLPLQAGIFINAIENTTAGVMRADATVTTLNIATISFDVTINANVVNGTIISNQAYVSADGIGSGAIADQPSDDPDTVTPNDPTRDVVGNQPLVDAQKTVSIQVDNGTVGILDPGDILRYTITISNSGASSATDVSFSDAVPANTTYIADSVTLNTFAVAQPDAGISPLIAGIAVSSSDLTPPLPTTGNGILTASQSAVISFDVQVNAGVASGTIISNQGTVSSNELPDEPTDADGIDSNGDQPTLIVVGNEQLLSITKTVSVIGGGAAVAGGQLEYRILVTNISSVAATNVTITDNLDSPVAGQLTYVNGSGLLNGLATGVSYSAPTITADYATSYGNLLQGETAELVFRVTINNSLPLGTTITNTGIVSWDAATKNASATISIDVGGTPGVANVNGKIWHDKNYDNIFDGDELELEGWFVDIYRNTTLLGTVISDASGNYSINGLTANDVGSDRYDIRFRAPDSNSTSAKLGNAYSDPALAYNNDLHRIYNIVLSSGLNVQNLNLPIDPNGVVYNSVVRSAISGATISLLNAGTGSEISSSCFDDVNQQNQITTTNGYYKFDLNFSQGDCIAGADYLIRITPPASGYNLNPSTVITPQTDAATAAFDVPNCPGTVDDDVATPVGYCEVQVSELTPALSIAPASAGTSYYLHLILSNGSIPGDSQIFNNHLPIDPILTNAVSITKTSAFVNVVRGKLVPYTITITNNFSVDLNNSNIIDNFPAGFKYVENSARFNNGSTEVPLEPVRNGLQLTWSNIDLPIGQTQTIRLLLIVGAAVNEGKYVNNVYVFDTLTNTAASGTASATVRVIADPDFDCSDVIGKVFDDKNLNGYQDEKEKGLAGVKLVTLRGLVTTSDKYGRFHVTCAVVPNESRGSNFVIKLDERTLPTGYRMTTENPRVLRATRGKMLKFNFGSTVHRVVSMDMADDVFVTNSTEMHKQWIPRIDLLIKHLQKKPSILRLTYLADVDDASIVDDRLEEVKQNIINKWLVENKYKLTIETKVFWRRGGPPDRGGID
jgi:uncharacterized repeat protein (TIGR01451 family)/fimbrial isopeptide formation D2 family protein